MTPPKTYQYQIQYVDNTYRMVDWTKAEFVQVGEWISEQKYSIVLSDGIFILRDIRAIVIIPEVEESKDNGLAEDQKLTEWGFVDNDTATYLKDVMGIDLMGGN